MDHWHQAAAREDGNLVCFVCLAGSWLSGRGLPPWQCASNIGLLYPDLEAWHSYGEDLPGEVANAMTALNYLREGAVHSAGYTMGLVQDSDLDTFSSGMVERLEGMAREMPDYEENPDAWHAEAETLYEDLKREGL